MVLRIQHKIGGKLTKVEGRRGVGGENKNKLFNRQQITKSVYEGGNLNFTVGEPEPVKMKKEL